MTWIGSFCCFSARSLLSGSHSLGKSVGFLRFVQVEGIGQDNAVEGFVAAVFPVSPAEYLLDVDGGDVVGEEDKLIGVEFLAVFAFKVIRLDKIGL